MKPLMIVPLMLYGHPFMDGPVDCIVVICLDEPVDVILVCFMDECIILALFNIHVILGSNLLRAFWGHLHEIPSYCVWNGRTTCTRGNSQILEEVWILSFVNKKKL